jgi:hypothetical protein
MQRGSADLGPARTKEASRKLTQPLIFWGVVDVKLLALGRGE